MASKYFLSLENKHQTLNTISKLTTEDGSMITNDTGILTECASFYKDLYTSENVDNLEIRTYLSKVNMPKLENNLKNKLDSEITEKELLAAVEKLKHNKSPGLDGIVPEFYQTFWHILKEPFIEMITETFEKGEMCNSIKRAVLTLIFKKGDKCLLKNYRPISLTNYDYKIIAFILANRLQQVIGSLIHHDQSGYIKGRYIGQNSRAIMDIYEYCEKLNLPGVILSLDFQKAFDRLEWNFMFQILEKYNFGHNFIRWIKILYNDPSIIIKNNGWLSKPIKTERGIRQGCPISSLLFILAVEVMSVSIRNNPEIEGFKFNDHIHKLSQYADDSTLMLSDMKSIKHALLTIENFCNFSGMKLNRDKTEGIWLGPFRNNPQYYEGIKFTCGAIKCLGIYCNTHGVPCLE